jgi:hypothetical protein
MNGDRGLPSHFRAFSPALLTLAVVAFGIAMVTLGVHERWALVAVVCFGAGVSLLALARMEWAILGLVVMANFDGFLKPLFSERFSLFFKDYFILLALVRWVWGLLVGEERPSLRTAVAVPAALFMGYVVAEIANPNASSLLASVAGVRAWLMWIPLFFVAYDTLRSRAAVERLWVVAIAVSIIVAVYGIVQYVIGFEHLYRLSDGFRKYAALGYYAGDNTRVTRVFSTMVHPGTLGTAMAFMLLVATGMAFAARRPAARALAFVSLPLMAVALFLSGTRTAMIGWAVGGFVLFVLTRRPVLLAAILVPVLFALGQAANLTGGAVEQRLGTLSWETSETRASAPLWQGFDTALQHPFGLGVSSGIGVGGFGLEPGQTSGLFIENDIGRAMGELGAGALLYLLLLGAAAVAGLRGWLGARGPGAAPLSAALVGALAGILVSLAAGAGLYLAPGAPYFWLALACVMRLPDLPPEEPAAPSIAARGGPIPPPRPRGRAFRREPLPRAGSDRPSDTHPPPARPGSEPASAVPRASGA